MSLNHRFNGAASSLNPVSAGLSYTRLDPEVNVQEDVISRYVLQSLRDQLTAHVSVKFTDALSLTLGSRYCKRINYKDYALIDMRLTYNRPLYNLYFDGSNLFDAEYVEAGAVPMPGRWYTLGVRFGIFK